jgi:hypothetical protein
MAAVTVDSRRDAVFGNLRVICAQIDIASDADTWVTGLHEILFIAVTSTTNNAIGATVSGGTATLQTGGAESNCKAFVVGL